MSSADAVLSPAALAIAQEWADGKWLGDGWMEMLAKVLASHAALGAALAEARQKHERLLDMIRFPHASRARELDRFCREVPPTGMCECGHRAELHDVRFVEEAYERYCTVCTCDEFRSAPPAPEEVKSDG